MHGRFDLNHKGVLQHAGNGSEFTKDSYSVLYNLSKQNVMSKTKLLFDVTLKLQIYNFVDTAQSSNKGQS